MSDFGIVTEAGAIRFERLLPAPIETVWAYLTNSELRARWLAAGPMDLRPGGAVELTFRNSELSAEREEVPERYREYEGVSMVGRVLRCEPPSLLVHSWSEPGESIEDSEVTFELEARGERTLLTLTHRKLPNRASLLGVAGGWHTHLGVLVDVLAQRPVRAFWSTHEAIEKAYEGRISTEA